ncbi:MAG: hypothetical protein QOE70_1053 [Chthoniobacter sp.]|jgi:hypothetical protein|nr:hypothetical protein [Chthoniobacter sp.]
MPAPGAVQFGLNPAQIPWLLAGALGGYLLMMFSNPVREAFRDGFRAIRRYPALWFTFGAFGFAYTLFRLILRIYSYCVLPPADRPTFMWLRAAWRDPNFWLTGSPESLWYLPPHGMHDAARDAVLPAFESVAGIFNNLVTTFPLATVAAVLFLVNWQGHQMVLLRALRRRYSHWGWPAYLGILISALAVIAKLLLYLAPPLLDLQGTVALIWLQWSPVVVWLAFLFEYLFGVCIQIYLILLAYCWVRGLTFNHAALLDFAIRRFAFVVKWAAVVMILSSLFIDLPLILKNFTAFQGIFPADDARIEFRMLLARSILTAFLLVFPTMQITLTFHNESIRQALRDHGRFLVRHGWSFAWFLAIAGLHFYLYHMGDMVFARAFGDGTALGIVWGLLSPWLNGLVGAWLLASWVCLYKRFDHGRPAHESWIKF